MFKKYPSKRIETSGYVVASKLSEIEHREHCTNLYTCKRTKRECEGK
jgi:hypothetical protein